MIDKQKSLDLMDLMKAYEVLRMRLAKASNIYNLEFVSTHRYFGIKDGISFRMLHAVSSKNINPVNSHAFKLENVSIISPNIGITYLLDWAKIYDIFIITTNPIKLLEKGETLESLCIEYDMRYNA